MEGIGHGLFQIINLELLLETEQNHIDIRIVGVLSDVQNGYFTHIYPKRYRINLCSNFKRLYSYSAG